MGQKKISVIVPAYNMEKYIERCLDSLIGQTYHNLEIIVVDDGSNDQTGILCDRYAKKDPRILVVHQENQGVSQARNVGLSRATGDYIGFMDSDEMCIRDRDGGGFCTGISEEKKGCFIKHRISLAVCLRRMCIIFCNITHSWTPTRSIFIQTAWNRWISRWILQQRKGCGNNFIFRRIGLRLSMAAI